MSLKQKKTRHGRATVVKAGRERATAVKAGCGEATAATCTADDDHVSNENGQSTIEEEESKCTCPTCGLVYGENDLSSIWIC